MLKCFEAAVSKHAAHVHNSGRGRTQKRGKKMGTICDVIARFAMTSSTRCATM